jgi:drug/metabolite transporter (DMT)-like permease
MHDRLRPGRTLPNWVLFLVPAFIWGTTWLTIKFQLGVVAPEVSVVYRFGLGSLVLFAWCAARRIPQRFGLRAHASFALVGLLQYAINYVLLYLSEEHLTSGLVAVVYVLVVAWNLVGTRLLFGAPLSPSVLTGAAIGMAGVAFVFWPELSRVRSVSGQGVGIALAIAGTLSVSAGNLCSQRLHARGAAIVSTTAWAMLYATVGVALYCAARGIPFALDRRVSYVVSLAYLVVFGSVIAFIAFLTLLARIGAGRAGYVTVLVPVLAIAMSTAFEGYRGSVLARSGMALVLVGNALVLRGKAGAPRT